MTVTELLNLLKQVHVKYGGTPIVVEGWNDSGDLTQVKVRGDLRVGMDKYGQPVIVLR